MIAVIDYGAGNLASVVNALRRVGVPTHVTTDHGVISAAEGVVFPGVGAASDTMKHVNALGLAPVIRQVIAEGTPFLGICMGMQALMSFSLEGGEHQCLGVVPGAVRRLRDGQPVPHMGWNQVRQQQQSALFDGIPDGAEFYFVHSYYVDPEDRSFIGATTEYGVNFASAFVRDNLFATQFHPEKSGTYGLRLLANFAQVVAMQRQRVA
ncbi:MAG TPA: imidazole glycerol phosphate synthase subunit HisH [Nitrolancea sp.]